MSKAIAIGAQDFEYLRKYDCFYIDKTDLIREWWENRDAVTLITRPRRFGKTLNMDMLNCFFSNRYPNRGDLFEGLEIWKNEKYRSLQGTYPVIFLSFANVKFDNFEDAKSSIKRIIGQQYDTNYYLMKDKIMSENSRKFFDSVGPDMTDEAAATALQHLCAYLSLYYGKKVLIFLDEYDTPLQEAYVYGYWDKMVGFIRSLFNSTFKTNPYLERAIMTGITRVSKESVFSDLNNLVVVTTSSESYCTQFGFTEEEVFTALDSLGMSDQKENVKKWYDGFTFGSKNDIYNPWSITGFLKEKIFKPYWANTSSNSLVDKLIREGEAETKVIMEDLLDGKCLETAIDEEIIFDQLDKNKDAIWSLLLTSGYLRIKNKFFDEDKGVFIYQLVLTNREVRLMFRKMISRWFTGRDMPYNNFIKAFLLGDLKFMNRYMNEVALASFSCFDTGNKPSEKSEPERFYHGFVLGLMVELGDRYYIRSNRESGFGRYDIMIEPKDPSAKAFVIEFKVHDPEDESSLQDTVKAALNQIEDMQYDAELISRGISKDNILHYGFAFQGKKVLIG